MGRTEQNICSDRSTLHIGQAKWWAVGDFANSKRVAQPLFLTVRLRILFDVGAKSQKLKFPLWVTARWIPFANYNSGSSPARFERYNLTRSSSSESESPSRVLDDEDIEDRCPPAFEPFMLLLPLLLLLLLLVRLELSRRCWCCSMLRLMILPIFFICLQMTFSGYVAEVRVSDPKIRNAQVE